MNMNILIARLCLAYIFLSWIPAIYIERKFQIDFSWPPVWQATLTRWLWFASMIIVAIVLVDQLDKGNLTLGGRLGVR